MNRYQRFLLIISLLHLLFFLIKISIGKIFIMDSLEYYKMAENILNHFEFYSSDLNQKIDPAHYTKRPPLYPIFVLFSSFFLKSHVSILFFQNVISVISIYITVKIFEAYYQKLNLIAFLLICAFSFNQFVYSNLVMSEILLQLGITLILYVLFKLFRTSHFKWLFYYQLLIACLFLIKPVFYPFVIPNIILTILIVYKKKLRILGYVSATIPIFILSIYSFWNFNRTGISDFSSIQNINLIEWNIHFFEHNQSEGKSDYSLNNQVLAESKKYDTYAEQQQYVKDWGINYIKENLISYTMFHLKGSLRMLLDPGRFDLFNFFNYDSYNPADGLMYHINAGGLSAVFRFLKTQPISLLFLLFLSFIANIVKALAFIYFILKNIKNADVFTWLILSFIGYIVLITGPLGASRFVVPISLLYISFSTLGITQFLKRNKNLNLFIK